MLTPGLTFGTGARVAATIGAGTTPDFSSGGFGFMNGGNLAIDTNAPSGAIYEKGLRLSAVGALYGTTTQSGTDAWIEGIRISSLGQIVYESANAANFASGNPVTAAGNFAVN
jgi:hypothetical protein